MSSLNGYDNSSFLIPAGNIMQIIVVAVLVWTFEPQTGDMGDLVSFKKKNKKTKLNTLTGMWSSGQLLALQWVIMDKQSSDGDARSCKQGLGRVQ